MKAKIREFEVNTWKNFVITHPSYKLAETCLDLVSPQMFWSISNQYPDLVTCLHVQIRLLVILVSVHGQLELLNLFVLFVKKLKMTYIIFFLFAWTIRAVESLCFVCKEVKNDLHHFLFVCPYFHNNFDSRWSNLDVKVSNSCPTDGSQISAFIKNLDQDSKTLLLLRN